MLFRSELASWVAAGSTWAPGHRTLVGSTRTLLLLLLPAVVMVAAAQLLVAGALADWPASGVNSNTVPSTVVR